jgi:hypothetical protein
MLIIVIEHVFRITCFEIKLYQAEEREEPQGEDPDSALIPHMKSGFSAGVAASVRYSYIDI